MTKRRPTKDTIDEIVAEEQRKLTARQREIIALLRKKDKTR